MALMLYFRNYKIKNMKIITTIATLLFTVSFLFAQEFSVKYEVNFESNNPEVQGQLFMLQGSTLQIYSKDNLSRVEMKMGGLMQTTTISDLTKGEGVMIMDGMMGKQAATFNNLEEEQEDDAEESMDIELVDETKEILGHTCKKAVVYGEDDTEMIYWYTEEVAVKEGALGQYSNSQIPGLPLEFSIKLPEMTMTFVATEFSKKLKKSKELFNLSIPEGYTEISIEQLQSIGGGM